MRFCESQRLAPQPYTRDLRLETLQVENRTKLGGSLKVNRRNSLGDSKCPRSAVRVEAGASLTQDCSRLHDSDVCRFLDSQVFRVPLADDAQTVWSSNAKQK